MMLTDLKAILIYILAALVLVLGLSTLEYRRMFKATDFALTTQNGAIKARNEEAGRRIEQLTNQRDALQGQLDKRHAAQENSDAQAVTQIAADDRQQRSAPVRVRVLDCTRDAGPGGGGAAGSAAPGAEAGATDANSASGLLPKEGAGRLADALTEVEGMSAAYASCRADLFSVRGSAPPDSGPADYALPVGRLLPKP
ncbi:hypothetical protein VLK31_28155 [Variovorax sp. H27-G14]|uniref:hypothetical protein n=1 Tax=Variovorax sp. H27-G14 TaxID=3111914 RepID=UPI0038FCB6E8